MVHNPEKTYWHHEKPDSKQEIITITLWPYRSLGSRGYLYLMMGFIGLIFILSLLFYSLGAWPVIGFLGIISGKSMLNVWKYAVVIATILSAIITPSTDPITQILMSGALLTLYFGGSLFLIICNK